jgi:carbon-monoxide dehydrogenase large subunit
MYATQAAEVMVDEESGRVRLLRMSAAHDVGKAINPLNCAAQIEGGVVMGIGSAIHEELVIDNTGKVRNPSFLDYHLVTSLDCPELIPIIVECAEPEAPTAPKAWANRDSRRHLRPSAMRSRRHRSSCYDLPLKPENVYWALKNKKRRLSIVNRFQTFV